MESWDRDERLAWIAATVIMVVATSATASSRLLGTDPFTWIFDALIVYVPTAVLVGVILLTILVPIIKRFIRRTAGSKPDLLKVEHTAA